MLSLRYGHHQKVPELGGILQMDDVPGMNEIKSPMALDQTLPLPTQSRK